MDQQNSWTTAPRHGDNTGLHQAPRYPSPEEVQKSYDYQPDSVCSYTHPPRNSYTLLGQLPNNSWGSSHIHPHHYACHYSHSYSPWVGYPQVPYSPLPELHRNPTGATLARGFSSCPNRSSLLGSVHGENQLQYEPDIPVVSSAESGQTQRGEIYISRSSVIDQAQTSHRTPSFPVLVSSCSPPPYSSRPLVPTVAPFEPSSTRQATKNPQPIISQSLGSWTPKAFGSVEAAGPGIEDFSLFPHTHTQVTSIRADLCTREVEKLDPMLKGVEHISEDPNAGSRSGKTSRTYTCSRPIDAALTDFIPRAQIGTVQAQRETGSSQGPTGHRSALDAKCTDPEILTINYAKGNSSSVVVCVPPGIECPDERRLQTLMVMETEARILDHLSAQRVERRIEVLRQNSIGGGHIFNKTIYGDEDHLLPIAIEAKRQDFKHSNLYQRLVNDTHLTPSDILWGLFNTVRNQESEKEYRDILSDPGHRFWNTFPSSSVPLPTSIPFADFRNRQLVSVFEITFKNLRCYSDGYSNFQHPLSLSLSDQAYAKGPSLPYDTNPVHHRSIPDWNIPEIRDNFQIYRDFRNNSCHVPYMGR